MLKLSDRLKSYIPFFGTYIPDKGTIFSAYITSGPLGSLYYVRHIIYLTLAILKVVTVKNISPYLHLYDQIKASKTIYTKNTMKYLDIGILPIPGKEETDILTLFEWQSHYSIKMIADELLVSDNVFIENGSIACKNDSLTLNIMGYNENRQVAIKTFPCIIGRSQKCDLQISDNFVSRRHISIDKLSDSTYTVMDLDSLNKTFLNQIELIPNIPYLIQKGDIITLSDHTITIL